jgi:hypothetical protein
MLLEGGKFGGTHVLSRPALALMTSDHLGARPSSPIGPGELLLGLPGYTFGLGLHWTRSHRSGLLKGGAARPQ